MNCTAAEWFVGAAVQTAAQAAHYPFFGIWGPYRSEMDPWQLTAKKPPPPRQYLWYFYNQTAQYLTDQVRLLQTGNSQGHSSCLLSAQALQLTTCLSTFPVLVVKAFAVWRAQRWRYRVDGCYLWSTGSWDVLAIYPESTSSEGSYFDPVVADIIAKHNKKVDYLRSSFEETIR